MSLGVCVFLCVGEYGCLYMSVCVHVCMWVGLRVRVSVFLSEH